MERGVDDGVTELNLSICARQLYQLNEKVVTWAQVEQRKGFVSHPQPALLDKNGELMRIDRGFYFEDADESSEYLFRTRRNSFRL